MIIQSLSFSGFLYYLCKIPTFPVSIIYSILGILRFSTLLVANFSIMQNKHNFIHISLCLCIYIGWGMGFQYEHKLL